MRSKIITSLIIFLGCLLSYFYMKTLFIQGDHSQLVDRMLHFKNSGELLSYGVRASGGLQYVPGPLIGVLVAIPYTLFSSPYAPMIFILLLHLYAYFIFAHSLKNLMSQTAMLVFTTLFWLSPWRASEVVLWNISYLIFFTSVHFYSGLKSCKKQSFYLSFVHILSIGLAFQIHYSAFILMVISSYFLLSRKAKINWAGVLCATILIGLMLAPFFIDLIQGNLPPTVSDADTKEHRFWGRGFVLVLPMLKGLLYWIRFSSLYVSRSIIKYTEVNWLSPTQSVQYLFNTYMYVMGVSTALLSVYFNFKYFQNLYQKLKKQLFIESIEHYFVASIIAILLATGMSSMTACHWHIFILYPIALIPFSIKLAKINPRYLKSFYFFFISSSIVINIFASMKSENHNWQLDLRQQIESRK